MNVRKVLKIIGDVSALFIAVTIVDVLAAAIGTAFLILLMLLGRWIGIDKDIFIYFALFCIFWKACDVLAWVVGKIADKIERKKEREYFERINRKL